MKEGAETPRLWCRVHKRREPPEGFGRDPRSASGRQNACRAGQAEERRRRYARRKAELAAGRAKPLDGGSYEPPRDGDAVQARRRVNHLVEAGLLPNPNDKPCVECGHLGADRRHEYWHWRGFAAEHHEDVKVCCVACRGKHQAEARRRRRAAPGAAAVPEQIDLLSVEGERPDAARR